MPVFRVEKNRDYTVMSNFHLKDRKLSLKSKGLLSVVLSLPDNWNYSMRGLAAISKDGEGYVLSLSQTRNKNILVCVMGLHHEGRNGYA